ncbi:MAG: hypothetical protein E7472_07465 [Ruminococcaceae bacterium]|nr:hypothetical protein [Oscillospiraceae bacterium]
MSKRRLTIIGIAAAVMLFAGAVGYAAGNYGSKTDPLITKSYLDSVVQPQMESELKQQLAEAEKQMRSTAPGEFAELSLSGGQTLLCSTGCEVLLCSGSASALGDLVDTTAGGSVGSGSALSANHLYISASDSAGLTAGSGGAKILVSGAYSLG